MARASLLRDTLRRYSKLLGGGARPVRGPADQRAASRRLALRMRQQCANAAAVAAWLADQPRSRGSTTLACPRTRSTSWPRSVFGGLFGAMVSFDLREGDRAALFRFVDGLRLVLPATSLGDIYTLVSVPIISSHRDLTPEQRAERGIGDGMVRLSIGIEDAGDMIEDLRQALQVRS